ncbi:MAG: NAD(P)-binding protein [Burkholderiaceae bacterium]|nr:NAD(P)-binding protein [Burkholderiaceae bacterium]
MTDRTLDADYVIVGAGAVGMAFADTLLTDSDATMIVVDRRHRPGGHWNDAYPFVRLHGPSVVYGVNSRALDSGRIDEIGLNAGLLELATGAEICAYFDQLMRQRLLPSGRVQYLPLSDFGADNVASSRMTGVRTQLRAKKKIVDTTIADTRVPATDPPKFPIAPGVRCVAPNELAKLDAPGAGFVVIGAGKTAMDAAVWLLEQGVDPDTICWIRPRDAWLLNRATQQPSYEFFADTFGALAAEMEAARDASSVDDLFMRLERAGVLRRIDPTVTPSMYRCAIVSDAELQQMRRISNVVRLGHVAAIESERIVLEHGVVPTSPGHIHVHCSADGIPRKPQQPIFQNGRIVPQYVRRCSPTFSAAMVAHIEATFGSDEEKNALCTPSPIPDEPIDWLRMQLSDARNNYLWSKSAQLRQWLASARLDAFSAMIARVDDDSAPEHAAILERYFGALVPGTERLRRLLQSAA